MKKITILFWCILDAAIAFSQVIPQGLRCDYRLTPLGIDNSQPVLSWEIPPVSRNFRPTAFELVISENPFLVNFPSAVRWSSGIVKSNENILVLPADFPLKSSQRYFWKVRVYDDKGNVSLWSEGSWFETAFLQPADWKAKWIGDGSSQFEKDEDFYKDDPMPLFQQSFTASKKVRSARLYISGLGYYEAYLNNGKVGDHVLDPGFTAYRKQVSYVVYDVTANIKKGKNRMGVMLGNGWYNPLPLRLFGRFNLRDHQETGRPRFIAQLEMVFDDGSRQTIISDESWKTAPGPVIRNNVYLGEHYDARKELSFDESANWKNAVLASAPSGPLMSQQQPPIRVTKVVKPVSIKETGKDTFIVDMGQNFAGVARIRVKGTTGSVVGIRYGEDLFKDGRLNYLTTVAGQIKEIWNSNGGPGSPKTAWQRDQYILKGKGEETWSPRFTFHGFRYLEITGWPGTPSLADIEGLRMNSDVESAGTFACSDPLFNRIHEVIQWTFLSNIFSVQSDCPGREKMGYGGDLVATGEAYIHNYNMHGFYSKTIQDFENDQQPDGGITEIAPSTGIADRGYGGMSGPLGWELAFPYLQKKLYDYYGDKKIIEKHYPAFKKQLTFLQSKSQAGLFFWDISDHEALDTKPEALTAACFYYHHVKLGEEFAGILGNREDSISYNRLARNIRQAIIDRYAVHGTGRIDNGTQSAQLFGLYYGLTPEKEKSIQWLLEEFKRHNDHISTGIFSTKMMFDVLRENNMAELAARIISQKTYPGWGYMIEKGATTLWETWQYPDNAPSQNHPMFGSVDEWFYKSLLGINQGAPGYSQIIIKPQPVSQVQWAKGGYESVKGWIKVDWKKEGDQFTMKVTIPGNTTARIYVPMQEGQELMESAQSIDRVASVKYLGREGNYGVIECGGGEYEFVAVRGRK